MTSPSQEITQTLLEPSSNNISGANSSSNSLTDEPTNDTDLCKSLDLSTSASVITLKPEELPSTSQGICLASDITIPTNVKTTNKDQMATLNGLDSIKRRVLNAVSNTNNKNDLDLGTERSDPSLETGATSSRLGPTNNYISHTRKKNEKFNPFDPNFFEYRTNLLWDFYRVDTNPIKIEIGALPPETQQNTILEELIYTLAGIRGSFITPLPRNLKAKGLARYETHFKVNAGLDKGLADLVYEILPLASSFMGIQQVMAVMDSKGQVNNALYGALIDLSQEYYLLLSQAEEELEKEELTMVKLVYYLKPTAWNMDVIWNCIGEIHVNNLEGAAVLSLMLERIKQLAGDEDAQKIMIELTIKASVPYMQMLHLWIHKGVILDNFKEFLIVDNVSHTDGKLPEHYAEDYWEKRYTICNENIPTFLQNHLDIILRTGKYLNVIRQCGKQIISTPTQRKDLTFDPNSENHLQVIQDAYSSAAKKLLDVLLIENDLMGHLQSVRRYLLLNQGDFIMEFMDACEDELSKNVDQVQPMTLDNILGLTLDVSSARFDPYVGNLQFELLTYNLVTQMSKIINQSTTKAENSKDDDPLIDLSGLECFAFTYKVKWPVSLVLNRISISKYQMLFRQLFYCRHVERQLCKIWKENTIAKKFSKEGAELYRSAFTLRQHMMNAIQNLEYYMMIEVIEFNWLTFTKKIKKVKNVDDLLSLHQDFLDLCLKNCLLTETLHLNRDIFKIFKICLEFCEFIQTEGSMDQVDTFAEHVKKFDVEFTDMLIWFLKQIKDLAKENPADCFINLFQRINFNGFYYVQLEKLCVKNVMTQN